MPNKKQLNNARRAALVLEARAGVIFASDHILEELCAATARIGRTVKAYAKLMNGSSDDRAIIDILVDLRHYCDNRGLAFHELDAVAAEDYRYEKADLA
jgi:hypothetical protein